MRSPRLTWIASALVLLWGSVAVLALLANPAASADSGPPPWEPDTKLADPNNGGLVLVDKVGAPIYHGDLSNKPSAFYAVAAAPGLAGDTSAQLSLATPKQGQPTNTWEQLPMTGTTKFPNPAAPANIKGLTVPVATGTDGDLSIGQYIGVVPNTITDPAYANLYEFRLATVGPAGVSAVYFRIDIKVTVLGTDADGNVT